MLQKRKHILSLILALLFLYPLVYQSIHAFEHTHDLQDSVCCSHCSHSTPGNTSQEGEPATSGILSTLKDECGICSFHYAKLQVNPGLSVQFSEQTYSSFPDIPYPDPFLSYLGYSASLRAPPSC